MIFKTLPIRNDSQQLATRFINHDIKSECKGGYKSISISPTMNRYTNHWFLPWFILGLPQYDYYIRHTIQFLRLAQGVPKRKPITQYPHFFSFDSFLTVVFSFFFSPNILSSHVLSLSFSHVISLPSYTSSFSLQYCCCCLLHPIALLTPSRSLSPVHLFLCLLDLHLLLFLFLPSFLSLHIRYRPYQPIPSIGVLTLLVHLPTDIGT